MKWLLCGFVCYCCLGIAAASPVSTARHAQAVRDFKKTHPCPAPAGNRCPGYVVDHIIPLCSGAPDRPDNMQWQEKSAAHKKDLIEWEVCAKIRKTLATCPR